LAIITAFMIWHQEFFLLIAFLCSPLLPWSLPAKLGFFMGLAAAHPADFRLRLFARPGTAGDHKSTYTCYDLF